MKQIAETACFVFVEEEVDKRSKMYKAVKKAGRAVEFVRQNEQVLTRWILSKMKRENKKITQVDMRLFLEKPATIWKILIRSWKSCSVTHWGGK